jgi:two-component system response regulator MprA
MIGCPIESVGEGGMKLLLIEDDEAVAQVLAEAFSSGGHDTAITHTGEEGLAFLTRERPDAVVLDVRLPKLNGVAVLRQIRSTDPTLPVIIMTGLATPGEIAEVRRLGVTEIIEKPEVLRHFSEALSRIAAATTPKKGAPKTQDAT